MRPALYSAEHRIFPLKSHLNDNLSAAGVSVTQSHPATLDFDIVGPICESSDVILRNSKQPAGLQSGDWMAIADVGAYGFVMASHYNLFNLPEEIFID